MTEREHLTAISQQRTIESRGKTTNTTYRMQYKHSAGVPALRTLYREKIKKNLLFLMAFLCPREKAI